jgi:hypothetical protein
MKIHILQGARQDLADAYRFYERNESGLGRYFLTSISADIESLIVYAVIHPQIWGYYRMLSKRFPFPIYYRQENADIYVWAVMDTRKNPAGAKNKLLNLS